MNKKHLLSLVTILLSSTVLLTACSSDSSSSSAVSTETYASSDSSETPSSLLVYGEVKVDQTSEIQLDFPARIENVTAKKGTIAHKGDVLLTLSYADYELELATLEKELEGYELEMKGLKSNTNAEAANIDALSKELALKKSYCTSGQDPEIISLQNNLVTLNADLKEAEKLYDSNRQLLESGAVSQNEVDQNKLACDKLKEQIENTQTSISKLKDARDLEVSTLQSKLNATTLEVSNIDINKASKINQLQNKIESTTLTLQNMKAKLAAPYLSDHALVSTDDNLLVYDVLVDSGSSISGLGQPLIKLMDLNTLYVTVDIPEESLFNVKIGDTVTLKIADQSVTDSITGTISRISEYATEKDGDTVVEAYIDITSGKDYLKPGLSVDAYIN